MSDSNPADIALHASASNAIRASETEIDRLIEELEAAANASASAQETLRATVRKPFPKELSVILETHDPSGENKRFLVRGQNLSDGGIGFIHGGFVHLDRRCTIEIYNGSDPLASISGTIIWCRHVTGMIHQVGVQFKQKIISQDLLQKKALPKETSVEQLELPRLKGQVLYIDGIEPDRRYTCLRFTQMGLSYRLASDVASAMKQLEDGGFSIVIADLRMKPDPAQFLIRRIRAAKIKIPIIVTGYDIGRDEMKELRDLGAQACLFKPYRPEQLGKLMSGYLDAVPPDAISKRRGMTSDYWTEPACRPLITEHLAYLQDTVERLTEIKAESMVEDQVLSEIKQLASTAALYGYPKIAESANELSTILSIEPLPKDMIVEQMIDMDALVALAKLAIG